MNFFKDGNVNEIMIPKDRDLITTQELKEVLRMMKDKKVPGTETLVIVY